MAYQLVNFLLDFKLVAALLLLLLVLFMGPWQTLCIEDSKIKCRELHTQLVKAWADGRVEFSDPAYKMLAKHLEFHSKSDCPIPFILLVAAFSGFGLKPKSAAPINDAINEVKNCSQRAELMHIYDRSIEVLILQATLRSFALPVLAVLVPIVLPYFCLRIGARKTRRFIVDMAKVAISLRTMM